MTTPPGDQPPYGGQQPPYQPPYRPYGGPGYWAPPDHPKAMTAMVLGIVGLVTCQLISPFAWSIGKSTLAEIDASGGRVGGRGMAQAGYVLGLIGTILLALAVAGIVVYLVFFVAVMGGMAVSG